MDRFAAFRLDLIAVFAAGLLSYGLSYVSTWLAWRGKFLDLPKGGRKIHQRTIPLLGGLGIALTIIVLLGLFDVYVFESFPDGLRNGQLFGYVAGVLLLVVGGMIDDRHPLTAKVQILFPILAAACVILGGTGIVQITQPGSHVGFSLVWWQWDGALGTARFRLSLPADALTFMWLLVATYATKVLDGLDGLVTGLTVIGSGIVGALCLSTAYFQPAVSMVAGIIGGSFLGFLPRNLHPAKQFLGESGATIAGFSLGVLAILSSAKIAMALCVLAIPIVDVVLVVLGRIRRGVPWYQGDDTHLHFRLLKAGFSQRTAVWLLWGVSLFAGIAALGLQTRGKLFLVAGLIVFAAFSSFIAGWRSKRIQPPS